MAKLAVTVDGSTFNIKLDTLPENGDSEIVVHVDGETYRVLVPDLEAPLEDLEWMIIDGRPYELTFDQDLRWLSSTGGLHRIEVRDREHAAIRPRSVDGRVKAPIPGLITHVLVEVGQQVEVGQPVIMLEAMKMENEIRAPVAGKVSAIHAEKGRSVLRLEVLAEITPSA